ncbi:unnamed protein product [Didymodactylos carnosus]|uniref:RBR-type E3 ubiquitin transferase n=1 Tax=Didymodactylos carnosus TaxID=1234261 RepID=A0A8S2DND1_9BILA|nr:unnamed protein product [Didymodactylos carnosus]CAF3729131.1 unnamed protein product [Didymodactylos carnosus]
MLIVVFEELTDGTTYTASLIHSFTLDHFRNSVPVLGDLGKYRLLIDDTQLCLDNENIFNTQKRLLYNGVKVTLLDRTYNGTLIEKTLLKEIVLEDLKTELPKLTKVTAVCMFCMCQEQCSIIHCTHVCADCFNNYLEQTDMQLKCLKESRNPADEKRICNTVVEYKTFFKTPEFIDKWSILCDVEDMIKNIDCQICYCGALLFNMTLYSKQQCSNCTRWLCFFCNRNWDAAKMNDVQYTCEDVDCTYERKLAYELVPLVNNPNVLIPNRRCCPKCFRIGAFDNRCKYHCCPNCSHEFCFICLLTKDQCESIFKSDCYSQCTSIETQHYSMFPKIIS